MSTPSPELNGEEAGVTDNIIESVSINPLDMVALAAEEQQENGTVLTLNEVLRVGSFVEVWVGGVIYEGSVADIDENWLYLEMTVNYERQLRMLNLRYLQMARTLANPEDNDPVELNEEDVDFALATERLRQKLAEAQEKSVTDISIEGIETFVYMKKMFDNVSWKNKSILVLDLVLINPPYSPDDCIIHSTDPRAEAAHLQVQKVMVSLPAIIENRKLEMQLHGLSLEGPPKPVYDLDEE